MRPFYIIKIPPDSQPEIIERDLSNTYQVEDLVENNNKLSSVGYRVLDDFIVLCYDDGEDLSKLNHYLTALLGSNYYGIGVIYRRIPKDNKSIYDCQDGFSYEEAVEFVNIICKYNDRRTIYGS